MDSNFHILQLLDLKFYRAVVNGLKLCNVYKKFNFPSSSRKANKLLFPNMSNLCILNKSTLKIIIYVIFAANIDDICRVKPHAVFPMDSNCAKYYNCSFKGSQLRHYAKECKYPNLFSTLTSQCEHFENVSCQNRMEPMTPCK